MTRYMLPFIKLITRYMLPFISLLIILALASPAFGHIGPSTDRPNMSPDIKFIVENLNIIQPELKLKVDPVALSQMGENEVGLDLERLEAIVLAKASFHAKEIKTLNCTHVACGGGGGGCAPPVCKDVNLRK